MERGTLKSESRSTQTRKNNELTAFVSIGISTLLGGIWGTIAAVVMSPPFPFIGFMMGGFLGLLLSPFFVFSAIRSGIRSTAIPTFILNTTLAVVVTAVGGEVGPLLAMMVTCIVYIATCLRIGSLSLKTHSARMAGKCLNCGYSLVGLTGNICPECGTSTTP